jgi:LysR family cys regulon transcriptional activator
VGLPVGHLFGTHTTRVGLKAGVFLRDYVYTFLEMLAPGLDREVVTEAMLGVEPEHQVAVAA